MLGNSQKGTAKKENKMIKSKLLKERANTLNI
jgi:hypothetical protein